MDQPQQAHTDVIHAFELGSNTKHFLMVRLTAIDKQCFLYVQPLSIEPFLLLITKGDTLIILSDIPHVGAEKLSKSRNIKLHCSIEIPCWNVYLDDSYTIQKFIGDKMIWDDKMCKYDMVQL